MSSIGLLRAALQLQDFCDEKDWRCCFIGGIAVLRWGQSRVIDRASEFEYMPDLKLRTCSAEDLMVMKLFAGRAIDIRDAEGIAVHHHKTLDWAYIGEQLGPFAE